MNETAIHVKTILVPLDGSAISERALDWAVELAGKHQSQIILLRVGKEPNVLQAQTLETLQAFQVHEEEKCRHYLQEVKARLKSQAFVQVSLEYADGFTSQAILEKARQLKVSLIVMNSHGRDGMARWWMGSVAEKVTRHAPCPVLLVRQADPDHSEEA